MSPKELRSLVVRFNTTGQIYLVYSMYLSEWHNLVFNENFHNHLALKC